MYNSIMYPRTAENVYYNIIIIIIILLVFLQSRNGFFF